MNNKKIYVIIAALLLVGVGAYLVLADRASDSGEGTPEEEMEETITVRGEIVCLPKVGDGPQTMECAFGVMDEEGLYYNLGGISWDAPERELLETGTEVEISGVLVYEEVFGPDGNPYDTVGIINVDSMTGI